MGTILTSADGSEWTARDSGVRNVVGNNLYSVVSGPNGYFAVGDSGIILMSEDGTSWKLASSGTPNMFIGVTYCSDRYIAAGAAKSEEKPAKTKMTRIFVSGDGKKWAVEGIEDAELFLAAACGSDRRIVLVGKEIAQSDPMPEKK